MTDDERPETRGESSSDHSADHEGTASAEVSVPAGTEDEEMLPDTKSRGRRKRTNSARQAVEWVLLVLGAVALALVIRGTLFQAFYIPSPSMEPTLHGCTGCDNDRILVNKLSYKLHSINRGDIVVFSTPPGEEDNAVKDLVKRVIALPGETIESRGDRVWITQVGRTQAQQLDEPYVNKNCVASHQVAQNLHKTTIPAGYYFVMGDNRCESHDSRAFGAIKGSTIVGRAFVRIWPPSRFKFL